MVRTGQSCFVLRRPGLLRYLACPHVFASQMRAEATAATALWYLIVPDLAKQLKILANSGAACSLDFQSVKLL